MTQAPATPDWPVSIGQTDLRSADADPCGPLEISGNYTFIKTTGWRCPPIGMLVKTVSRFSAEVQIWKDTHKADGRSLVELLTLGVRYGDTLTLRAIGPDAQAALEAVAALSFLSRAELDARPHADHTALLYPVMTNWERKGSSP